MKKLGGEEVFDMKASGRREFLDQELLTFCHMCPGRCARKAIIKGGRLISMEQDWESGLPTEFCPMTKGAAIPEICDHPARLKYPQKRVGERGEGKWERVTWDEALDTIAERLKSLKEKFGPECLAMLLGEPKGIEYAYGQRFATSFGTPNVVTPGHY
jgi:thiosulfate reductase/polysulfide reductase chain A